MSGRKHYENVRLRQRKHPRCCLAALACNRTAPRRILAARNSSHVLAIMMDWVRVTESSVSATCSLETAGRAGHPKSRAKVSHTILKDFIRATQRTKRWRHTTENTGDTTKHSTHPLSKN